MLNVYVIFLEVILKSMTSLGNKKSSVSLKIQQLWSSFIFTSFILERLTLAKMTVFHVSQARLFPVCFRDISKLHFLLFVPSLVAFNHMLHNLPLQCNATVLMLKRTA